MASFDGVNFIVDMDGYAEHRVGRISVQEIPGSSNFYVDTAGRGPMYVDMKVLLQNVSLLGALMANLGQPGSLSVDGRDGHTAILMDVTGDAQYGSEQLTATLKFLVTDS